MKSTTYGDGFQGRIRPAKRAWLLCANLAFRFDRHQSVVRAKHAKINIRDKPMTPERWKQVNLSFSRYGDRLDFDKELFTYELFHNNQRACGRAFRVDVAVSSFTQRLQVRCVGQVIVKLHHIDKR